MTDKDTAALIALADETLKLDKALPRTVEGT